MRRLQNESMIKKLAKIEIIISPGIDNKPQITPQKNLRKGVKNSENRWSNSLIIDQVFYEFYKS